MPEAVVDKGKGPHSTSVPDRRGEFEDSMIDGVRTNNNLTKNQLRQRKPYKDSALMRFLDHTRHVSKKDDSELNVRDRVIKRCDRWMRGFSHIDAVAEGRDPGASFVSKLVNILITLRLIMLRFYKTSLGYLTDKPLLESSFEEGFNETQKNKRRFQLLFEGLSLIIFFWSFCKLLKM